MAIERAEQAAPVDFQPQPLGGDWKARYEELQKAEAWASDCGSFPHHWQDNLRRLEEDYWTTAYPAEKGALAVRLLQLRSDFEWRLAAQHSLDAYEDILLGVWESCVYPERSGD